MKLLLAIVFVAAVHVATAQPITTPVEAFNRAYLYTGFKEIKSMTPTAASAMATCQRLERDNTPFLSDSINGRAVWIVELRNVRLDLPSWNSNWVDEYNPKSFTAIIDSVTGRLLNIYTSVPSDDPNLAPEPPADTAAAMMRQTGEEYLGFPSAPPQVTFLQALDQAGGSDPLRAEELLAVCVEHKDEYLNGGKPQPVWCITGRGIEPLEFTPSNKPRYMRNRRRSIVDATTGKLLRITTIPPVMIPFPSRDNATPDTAQPEDSSMR